MAAKVQRFLQNHITGIRGLHPTHIRENIAREKYSHARRRRLQRAQINSTAGTARVATAAKSMAGTASKRYNRYQQGLNSKNRKIW